MNDHKRITGVLIQVIALVVLVWVDWRIAVGVFVWEWGGNLINTVEMMEVFSRRTKPEDGK